MYLGGVFMCKSYLYFNKSQIILYLEKNYTLFGNLAVATLYGLMTEELVSYGIRIKSAAGRGNSDSGMMSFEAIIPSKLQSTMKALL